FQAEDGIRDKLVTGVQTCALPIYCRTVPCNPGRSPVPVNFRSAIAPPVARLPRITTGSLVRIATSNFQSRNGGSGKENSGRAEGGFGAGLPGKPIGIRSMVFKK